MLIDDQPCSVPTTRLDLMGAATAADPWPSLRDLREQGPVVWHEEHRRWLVTTDRAIRRILVDPQHFTVERTSVAALFGADAGDDCRRLRSGRMSPARRSMVEHDD